jgi:hypothetical protein
MLWHLATGCYRSDYKWVIIRCGLELNEKFDKRRIEIHLENKGAIIQRAIGLTSEREFCVWRLVCQAGCIDHTQIWDMWGNNIDLETLGQSKGGEGRRSGQTNTSYISASADV